MHQHINVVVVFSSCCVTSKHNRILCKSSPSDLFRFQNDSSTELPAEKRDSLDFVVR